MPGAKIRPVRSAVTASGSAPELLAMTAVPRICASAAATSKGSCHADGIT